MIGARDKLDRRLVELYQNVQTINLSSVQAVNSDDMWRKMGLLSLTNRAFVDIKHNKRQADLAAT